MAPWPGADVASSFQSGPSIAITLTTVVVPPPMNMPRIFHFMFRIALALWMITGPGDGPG
jgi:hypothetical protein